MLLPVYDNAVLWNRLHTESRQGIHNTQTHRQTQTDTHTPTPGGAVQPSFLEGRKRKVCPAQAAFARQSPLAAPCVCLECLEHGGPSVHLLSFPRTHCPVSLHGRRASGHGGASTVSSCLLGLSNASAELMEHHIPHPCVPVLTELVSQLSEPPWGVGGTDGKPFKD